ncbi:MAG TPA: retinol dehydrogenase, partial [Balneolaceae bacterium]|nr:retinol dehydrogenase [Balneolaceae bacterium]
MNNKLCVITGANSGIGFETTKALAKQGAYIVMVCRNEDKAEAA